MCSDAVRSLGRIFLSVALCCVIAPVKSVFGISFCYFFRDWMVWPYSDGLFCMGVVLLGLTCGFVSGRWVRNISVVEAVIGGTLILSAFFVGSQKYAGVWSPHAITFSLVGVLMIPYGVQMAKGKGRSP